MKNRLTLAVILALVVFQIIAADRHGGTTLEASPLPDISVTILDTLGTATPDTKFYFGSGPGGSTIHYDQYVGPEFTITQPTVLTEIGAFVNNCETIIGGVPYCPGTLPFIVQIRPSLNGAPDASTVIASYTLSHDNDPLVTSFESITINLALSPGSYFALFAPQNYDAGFLLGNTNQYQSGSCRLGYLVPSAGRVLVDPAGLGAVRILGKIQPDTTPPSITIISPQAKDYIRTTKSYIRWTATDAESGIASQSATLDNIAVWNGQMFDLFSWKLGSHIVIVTARDNAGNTATASITFNIVATIDSLITTNERACGRGWINSADVCSSLADKLTAAKEAIARGQNDTAKNQLNAFINQLDAQKGKAVNQQAYDLLKADALYVIAHLP